MPLTPSEAYILQSWSFATDYNRYHPNFINLAVLVHGVTENVLGRSPSMAECLPHLEAVLSTSLLFQGLLGKKYFLTPTHHPLIVQLMARKILCENWLTITSPSSNP